MEENNNEISYKRVTSYSNDREEKVSFGKHFFLPFLSGALGATLIVGTCFGVPSIKEFALPLMIGIVAGTYSSIFIAGPMWSLIRGEAKDAKKANK